MAFLLSNLFFLFMSNFIIVDFSEGDSLNNWYIVDDGVMGGLSQGSITLSDEGYALFSGTISLDNYGGFSSVRFRPQSIDASKYSKIAIKLKGDQKKYQIRLKTSSGDYYSYVSEFTTKGEWETVVIDLNEFYPSFRGRKLRKPNFPSKSIGEIGFLFGNKKVESFALQIEKIYLLK